MDYYRYRLFFLSSSLCLTFQELFIYSLRNRETKKNKIPIESIGVDQFEIAITFFYPW